MTFLIPILILIFLIVAISIAVNRLSFKRTHVSEQKVKSIFLIYFGVLVLAMAVYIFLPKDYYYFEMDGQYYEVDQANLETEYGDDYFSFYEVVAEDKIDEIEDVYIEETWEFDYEDDTLTVRGSDYFPISTFVEEKEVDDDKIEITLYRTKATVEGIDISDQIKLPKLSLKENQLFFTPPERLEMSFYRLDKEAVITQFTGNPWYDFNHRISKTGAQMLYIKVPKDLKIEEDNVYIDYVHELRKKIYD